MTEQHSLAESKRHIVEALIFASDEPLTLRQIVDILGSSEHQGPRLRMKEDDVLAVIRELNAVYVQQERSFRIIQVAGGLNLAALKKQSVAGSVNLPTTCGMKNSAQIRRRSTIGLNRLNLSAHDMRSPNFVQGISIDRARWCKAFRTSS